MLWHSLSAWARVCSPPRSPCSSVCSSSGDHGSGVSYTGFATVVGDDFRSLNITRVSTFESNTLPYQVQRSREQEELTIQGRYPCGSFFFNGTWYQLCTLLSSSLASFRISSSLTSPRTPHNRWRLNSGGTVLTRSATHTFLQTRRPTVETGVCRGHSWASATPVMAAARGQSHGPK